MYNIVFKETVFLMPTDLFILISTCYTQIIVDNENRVTKMKKYEKCSEILRYVKNT